MKKFLTLLLLICSHTVLAQQTMVLGFTLGEKFDLPHCQFSPQQSNNPLAAKLSYITQACILQYTPYIQQRTNKPTQQAIIALPAQIKLPMLSHHLLIADLDMQNTLLRVSVITPGIKVQQQILNYLAFQFGIPLRTTYHEQGNQFGMTPGSIYAYWSRSSGSVLFLGQDDRTQLGIIIVSNKGYSEINPQPDETLSQIKSLL